MLRVTHDVNIDRGTVTPLEPARTIKLGRSVAHQTRLGSLVGLSRGQHTKLTAVGISHGHPADLALTDVDASRAEGDETVDLLLLITMGGWSEVET